MNNDEPLSPSSRGGYDYSYDNTYASTSKHQHRPPIHHPMTIVESPQLSPCGEADEQWGQNPRLAPPSPHVHYHGASLASGSAQGQMIDEDLRLRIVRTPTESLHEAAREDERRRIGKRKRKGTLRKTLFGGQSKLARGFSMGGSGSSRPGTAASDVAATIPLPISPVRPGTAGSATSPGGLIDGIGMGLYGMNEFAHTLQQQQQQASASVSVSALPFPPNASTRTANQEEEAKAESFATPAIAQGESSSNAGGLPSSSAPSSSSTNVHPVSTSKGGLWSSIFSSKSRRKDRKAAELRRRRNVYLNIELPMDELDKYGLPKGVYSRNKVRTSKYTIWTFVPKNLSEQFRRVANLYFLGLIILQSGLLNLLFSRLSRDIG